MPNACANCRITIRGSFDLNWAEYVGDTLVHVEVKEGAVQTTTLIGHPIDLAAFLGTLHLLVDRGFHVIAFEFRESSLPETDTGTSVSAYGTRA